MTSAVARLASTFGPATPLTTSPAKTQTAAALTEVTNGVAATAGVRDEKLQIQGGRYDVSNMLTVFLCVLEAGRSGEVVNERQSVVRRWNCQGDQHGGHTLLCPLRWQRGRRKKTRIIV